MVDFDSHSFIDHVDRDLHYPTGGVSALEASVLQIIVL